MNMSLSNLSGIKDIALRGLSHSGLVLKKVSPEILVGVGIVGAVVATVMACKATRKLDTITSASRVATEEIKSRTDQSEEDMRKDIAEVQIEKVVSIVKLYGPSVAVGVLSIGCILGSHHILNTRNASLMAAYKVVSDAFKRYRENVIEEFGPEKDKELAYKGPRDHHEIITDKDGKQKKVSVLNPAFGSPYARFFDESSPQFQRNYEYNLFFLKTQQNNANDLLRTQGHVFLNEIYDMLGLPRSKAGQIVGWVYGGKGDNVIDFNVFNAESMAARDTINGYSRAFLLDFNVDGVVWDLI